jgi:hypothetical protein
MRELRGPRPGGCCTGVVEADPQLRDKRSRHGGRISVGVRDWGWTWLDAEGIFKEVCDLCHLVSHRLSLGLYRLHPLFYCLRRHMVIRQTEEVRNSPGRQCIWAL